MSDVENTCEIIQSAKAHNWLVGLYGLGKIGKSMGEQLLKWIGLKPDFVSDKNRSAIDVYINLHTGVRGIPCEDLLEMKENVLIMACVGGNYVEEVCGFLSRNPFLHIIRIDDIIVLDSVLEKFYNVRNIRSYGNAAVQRSNQLWHNDRIAVYTCVTGGYDDAREPLVTEDNCDYYFISDRVYAGSGVFRQLCTKDIVPGTINGNAEKNRWCKMYGHKIFKAYKYSIYMDGSVTLKKPISHYVDQIGSTGIAIHKHPVRNCIYEEGMRLIVGGMNNINYKDIRRQMLEYLKGGMSREYGLFECTMLVRDHTNSRGNQIMEQWFDEYMRGVKRDQLSLTYILWKNGISYADIGVLNDGRDIRENPDLILNMEHKTGNCQDAEADEGKF